ncbi:hypothetical protein [Actinomadura formosensis]|uniref:hypothetical protein n=2 Tax=Actinomadura formosensis TaxID=60706 RepID=UPI000AE0C5A5
MPLSASKAQVSRTAPALGPAEDPDNGAVPAQKVALTRQNRDCLGMPIGPTLTQSFGFSVVRRTGSNMIVTTVVLQGAAPNATYTIRLIQLGPSLGTSDCQGSAGTVTTDEYGNGEANVRENVLPGATHVFVDLNNAADPNGDYFTTEPVSLFR